MRIGFNICKTVLTAQGYSPGDQRALVYRFLKMLVRHVKTNPPAPECSVAGGWLYALSGKSTGVAFIHHDVAAAAIAPHTKQRFLVGGFLGHLHCLLGVFYWFAIDFLDYIARSQTRFGR